MENEELKDMNPKEEQQPYTPRPRWQVWIARIGLVLFIAMLIMYYIHMLRGGM